MANDVKRFISVTVAFTDTGTSLSVGSLPANGIITDINISSSVAFDGTGTDLIVIGTSSDDNRFADAVDVSSTGKASVTQLNTGAVESAVASTEIFAKYTDSNTDAAAGACNIVITYMQV